MSDRILLETNNAIAALYFNNPEKYNSFDLEIITAFADAIITLASDDSIRGVIITGKGSAFCSGGDLRWASGFPKGAPAAFHELSSRFHQSITEIRRMKKPVIAAINGIAAGGGFSLALACDFRIMGKSAVLRQGFTSNGLSMDGGGTWTLPRIVGLSRAMEIAALDMPISADEALELGLATRVAADDALLAEAEDLIDDIGRISLHSFACSKELLNDSFTTTLESQLEKERAALSACAAHPDGAEGIRAFLEKRKPSFRRG